MGELAKGGSVAVVVGVSDFGQVTGDMQHTKHDPWYMTTDKWNLKKFKCLILLVVSLSVS